MPGISRIKLSPRLAAIESELKKQKAEQKNKVSRLQSLYKGKLLAVKNSNETRFVMHMPKGDSPLIEALASRHFGFRNALKGLMPAPKADKGLMPAKEDKGLIPAPKELILTRRRSTTV